MNIRTTKKNKIEISLNDPIGTDKDGNEISFNDILGTDADTIIDDIDNKMQVKKLYRAIHDILSDRERLIIIKRYGLEGQEPKTQREVAKELGISRSYVSRIEKKAVLRMREAFSDEIEN
ncbi:sigma-70 family RNA polymerase sigma factor [Anaerovorax odorimutans]|uniref:sigma-70 family RNA polymerase sigma factor n=1 Tax=Anaerovorax odorimutans TaxID=109327 RepID=UPI000407C7A2|nr:sigma-70 family RNA polymerase sigma factor [Anaerovorax odorimutans]